MKPSMYSLLWLLLISGPLLACQVSSEHQQIAMEEKDLKREIGMLRYLVNEADKILLATATSIDADNRAATFELIEALFGHSESSFNASWDGGKISIGCGASYGFYNILLESEQSYLLYLKDGKIHRASANQSRLSGMSFIHELSLVRRQLLSN